MNLYSYIEHNVEGLSKNELRVREYLLNNYHKEFKTTQISNDLFISASTVSRYLKKINYKSIYQLNADKKLDNEDYSKVFERILQMKTELLSKTAEINSVKAVKEFTDILTKVKTIYIYGLGYSSMEGRNLQLRLSRIGYRVILLYNRHDMMMLSSSKEMKNSVCLFISQTGETEELIQTSIFLKEYDVKKLLLTNNPHSTLAKECDHQLLVPKIYSGYLMEIIFSEVTISLLLDFIYAIILLDNYDDSIKVYNKTKLFLKKNKDNY